MHVGVLMCMRARMRVYVENMMRVRGSGLRSVKTVSKKVSPGGNTKETKEEQCTGY